MTHAARASRSDRLLEPADSSASSPRRVESIRQYRIESNTFVLKART